MTHPSLNIKDVELTEICHTTVHRRNNLMVMYEEHEDVNYYETRIGVSPVRRLASPRQSRV